MRNHEQSKQFGKLEFGERLENLEFVGEESYERKNKMQRRIGDNKRA